MNFFAPANPGHLVNFEPQPVARAVREILGKAVALQDAARRRIHIPGRHARPDRILGGFLGLQDGVDKAVEPSGELVPGKRYGSYRCSNRGV